MDIKEVKKAKSDLQTEMTTMLISFQETYKVQIEDVRLHTVKRTGNYIIPEFLEIIIRI